MPKRDQKHMNEQRQKILKAAQKCINEEGYEKLSIRRIIEIAAISNGALYTHFKNKQEIVLGLLDEHLAFWQQLTFNTCGEFKAFLHNTIDEAWQAPLSHHQNSLSLLLGAMGNPTLNDVSTKFLNERRLHIHRIFLDLQTRGEISQAHDIEYTTQWLVTFLHGFHLSLAFSPPNAFNRAKDMLDREFDQMI